MLRLTSNTRTVEIVAVSLAFGRSQCRNRAHPKANRVSAEQGVGK